MNLHKQFIEDTNLTKNYVEWLENRLINQEKESGERADAGGYYNNIDRFVPPKPKSTDFFKTEVEYDVDYLSYATEVWFHTSLAPIEMKQVEDIINYWSSIPYVSVEGNYGIEWSKRNGMSRCLIQIDFTKSASDDYGAREILEKLADWIENGTPVRKNNTRKYEGVMRPLRIAADCP